MERNRRYRPIWVAIDHGDTSLRKYAPALDSVQDCKMARRALLRHFALYDVSGLAIGIDEIAYAARIIEPDRIILGLPDLNSWDDLLISVDLAKKWRSKCETIKLAIGGVVLSDLVENGEEAAASLIHDASRWFYMIEPYFGTTHTPEECCKVIESFATFDEVKSYKLPIGLGEEIISMYSTACKHKPWYARSSGLSFPAFCNRLALARRHGCSGVVVGGALWGDELVDIIQRSEGDINPAIVRKLQVTESIIAGSR